LIQNVWINSDYSRPTQIISDQPWIDSGLEEIFVEITNPQRLTGGIIGQALALDPEEARRLQKLEDC
jgi:hypothetical protein